MLVTEAAGSVVGLEAAHTSDPPLDPAMILFRTVVQVSTRSVPDRLAQHASDRSRVGAMTVRRHPIWTKSYGRTGQGERLGGPHVAVLAAHCVDQVSVAIDRPIR